MRKFYQILAIIIFLGVIISAFIAYFVFSFDAETGVFYDGFGREMSKAPKLVSIVLGEKGWRGIWWQFFDIVVLWSGLMGGFKLFMKADEH